MGTLVVSTYRDEADYKDPSSSLKYTQSSLKWCRESFSVMPGAFATDNDLIAKRFVVSVTVLSEPSGY